MLVAIQAWRSPHLIYLILREAGPSDPLSPLPRRDTFDSNVGAQARKLTRFNDRGEHRLGFLWS